MRPQSVDFCDAGDGGVQGHGEYQWVAGEEVPAHGTTDATPEYGMALRPATAASVDCKATPKETCKEWTFGISIE